MGDIEKMVLLFKERGILAYLCRWEDIVGDEDRWLWEDWSHGVPGG